VSYELEVGDVWRKGHLQRKVLVVTHSPAEVEYAIYKSVLRWDQRRRYYTEWVWMQNRLSTRANWDKWQAKAEILF
jgi:hypothetical protein